MVRLVAIDVDGTLLNSDHQTIAENTAAIIEAERRGVHVVVCTSRPPLGALHLLPGRLQSAQWLICCQGALTLEVDSGRWRTLVQSPIPLTLARNVAQMGEKLGGTVNWYADEVWYVAAKDSRVVTEAAIVGFEPTVIDLGRIGAAPHKMLVIARPGTERMLEESFRHHKLNVEVSKPGYLEITAAGVKKGRALKHLLDRLNIDEADAVAIGDGENDRSMFEVVGMSIAMGNASDSVKGAASRVTGTNDDAGVAQVLREILSAQPDTAPRADG